MASNIFGEESNVFTNSSGESVTIKVGPTKVETCQILEKILYPNLKAAELLATEVHTTVTISKELEDETQKIPIDVINSSSVPQHGIWIDPIDATSEYIKGHHDTVETDSDEEKIHVNGGLGCVTVLIGVFALDTGFSIFGVINQPFRKFSSETGKWTGRQIFGMSAESFRLTSLGTVVLPPKSSKPVIMISEYEADSIKDKLGCEFDLVSAPGAGYKLLCVIIGLADYYVLSRNSTYLWDTCAPHAILKSLGGGIDNLKGRLSSEPENRIHEITYQNDHLLEVGGKYANVPGFFAFRESKNTSQVLNLLKP